MLTQNVSINNMDFLRAEKSVLTQNLTDREFCLSLADFWKSPNDR